MVAQPLVGHRQEEGRVGGRVPLRFCLGLFPRDNHLVEFLDAIVKSARTPKHGSKNVGVGVIVRFCSNG
jgi:hypothetical protein